MIAHRDTEKDYLYLKRLRGYYGYLVKLVKTLCFVLIDFMFDHSLSTTQPTSLPQPDQREYRRVVT